MIHGNDFEKTPVCLAQNVAVAGYNNNNKNNYNNNYSGTYYKVSAFSCC